MKPGEILPGDGAVPTASVRRRGTIPVRNSGRLPAYLGSHFPLVRASAALEFDREGLEGARPELPAGASVRIEPGARIELPIVWT